MKTAFVTGADRGLGNGFVEVLLERGFNVIAGEYNKEWSQLDRLKCDRLSIVPLDVSDQNSVDAVGEYIKNNTDGIDLLISNAGISNRDSKLPLLEKLDTEAMLRVYNVNAIGPLRVCRALIPYMVGMKRICIVSSEVGSVSRSHREGQYAYCMSKSALNMATSIMFNDFRKKGYTFRIIHPGWVQSYMGGKLGNGTLPPVKAATIALHTFLDREIDEDKLVMYDDNGEIYPW